MASLDRVAQTAYPVKIMKLSLSRTLHKNQFQVDQRS